ncbi:MAG: shikimate dehydrogenase [Bacteroidota bacterium]
MRRFALIGFPLGHSFSKRYFTEKFEREGILDAVYDLFPLENIQQFSGLFESYPDLVGLNVTIPYKEAVIPFLQQLDETAAAVGAVNCIHRVNGLLTGYNTDVYGFDRSLPESLCGPDTRALVLGTGGASKAVKYILAKRNIPFLSVSRNPRGADQVSYQDIPHLIGQYNLIINTTPLGMAPNLEAYPELPYELLGSQHFVYDLVYNPTETVLLQRAQAQGCTVMNGLDMLYFQAEKAWAIWTKKQAPDSL